MLQKELAKRLKARYDTKMDGNGWLEEKNNDIYKWKTSGKIWTCRQEHLQDKLRTAFGAVSAHCRQKAVGLLQAP